MKNKQKPPHIDTKTQEAVDAYRTKEQDATDPLGSYTGVPKDKREIPVQDADDL